VIIAVLLVGGFFRSLQFTALNAMGYADVSQAQMSRASSLSSMFQQLAQSLGVGLAAVLIHYTLAFHHAHVLSAEDITPAFAIVAVLSLIAVLFFVTLPTDAGAEVSGRLPRRDAVVEEG
jgi:hypothetical protein